MKKCKECNKSFESKWVKQIFCNKRCKYKFFHRKYYNKEKVRNREYDLNRIRQDELYRKRKNKRSNNYYKENKEKIKRIVKGYYWKKKDNWTSRNYLTSMLKSEKWSYLNSYFEKCERCGIKSNLEKHHELYPLGVDKIAEAVINGKIKCLCKNCHIIIHGGVGRS